MPRKPNSLSLIPILALLATAGGCSGCEEGADGSGGNGAGSSESNGTQSNGTQSTGTESVGSFSTGASSSTGEACTAESQEATLTNRPVDIVFVIDNSGSMSAEIVEVEKQINQNFATILDAAMPAIDYRVIMVSQYGNSASQRICIAAPLGGIPDANNDGHCDTIPAQPVNTAKFFHHSTFISSHNALCRLIQQYSAPDDFNIDPTGYQSSLRADSFKFFVAITDDNVSTSQQNGCTTPLFDDQNTVNGGQASAANFEAALFGLSNANFGTGPEDRNYRFWSIIGLAPFNPTAMKAYGDPHPPDEMVAPIILNKCTPSSVNSGTGYQALSIMSGGYRFPSCGLEYTDMFQLMAQGVIDGAKVACEFDIPEPPVGQMLDLNTVQVVYSSGGAEVAVYNKVDSAAACTPTSFYYDMDKIVLCPDACTTVQGDPDAKIDISFGCVIDPQ